MRRGRVALAAAVLLAAGCTVTAPPPAATAVARPSAKPADWPPIVAEAADVEAFRRLCPALRTRADPSGLTQPDDWTGACTDRRNDGADYFRRHFAPVRLGDATGFTTGYYVPEIPAYRVAAAGSAPVLARPPELTEVDLGRFALDLAGRRLRGLVQDGQLVRAPDRAAIEAGAFAGRGLELAWAADPADLFFLQIQGSGQLRFPDGGVMRIGYAGQNGHAYVPVGRLLRQRGAMETVDLPAIRAWMRAQPDRGASLMRENPSYIFFRPLADTLDGPPGALGVPLLAERHVAVDPAVMPLGAPVWLETRVEGAPYARLLIAADTGGAIRGANRFDIFFGAGSQAERKAGGLQSPVRATILLPRAAVDRLG